MLQRYIQKDWDRAETGMTLPDGYGEEMFGEIKTQLKESSARQKGRLITMRRTMIGVAAAMVLLAVGAWLLWTGSEPATARIDIPAKAAPATEQYAPGKPKIIHSNKDQTLRLPDGSTVVLYANSTLTYPEPFEQHRRALTLEGKALFTVAKDEARPFIVTAGAIETTVLGTEFSVTEAKHGIIIRLYSGRIRLHATDQKWRNDIVLAPGEQLNYSNKETYVSNWTRQPQEEEAETTMLEQALVFDNEPLPQVIDKLAEGYSQAITYNKEQIRNVYFTGTVQTSDSLTTILHVIATMNDLTIIPRKKGYSIRKKVP